MRLKSLLLRSVDLASFRCAWYFFRLERTGEPYAEQPGEAVATEAKMP